MKPRWWALVAAMVLLGATGLFVSVDELVTVTLKGGALRVLRFGPRATLGHCLVTETDDPSSDVLVNLIDVEGRGRSQFRMTAFIRGQHWCEERRFGLWWAAPDVHCQRAVDSCQPEK